MHPGRRTAMVHLLPVFAAQFEERGLVSFTSGVDYQRTEFHGAYHLERTSFMEFDKLFLEFRYFGELTNDVELIPHHLKATTQIDAFTYRDSAEWVSAQITTEEVGMMYMEYSDHLHDTEPVQSDWTVQSDTVPVLAD